jgi:hypothetical protein
MVARDEPQNLRYLMNNLVCHGVKLGAQLGSIDRNNSLLCDEKNTLMQYFNCYIFSLESHLWARSSPCLCQSHIQVT